LFPGIFRHAKTGATAAPFGLRELLFAPFLVHFHGFFSHMVFFLPEWRSAMTHGYIWQTFLHIIHINLKV